jgi:hypothetical protein
MDDALGATLGVGLGATLVVTSGAATELSLFTTFPLLQTNFPPFFRHLNSLPLCVLVIPFLLQLDPAFGVLAEKAGKEERLRAKTRQMRDFLIAERIEEIY